MYAFLVILKLFHFIFIKIRLTARFTCPMQNDVCAVAPRCPSAPPTLGICVRGILISNFGRLSYVFPFSDYNPRVPIFAQS